MRCPHTCGTLPPAAASEVQPALRSQALSWLALICRFAVTVAETLCCNKCMTLVWSWICLARRECLAAIAGIMAARSTSATGRGGHCSDAGALAVAACLCLESQQPAERWCAGVVNVTNCSLEPGTSFTRTCGLVHLSDCCYITPLLGVPLDDIFVLPCGACRAFEPLAVDSIQIAQQRDHDWLGIAVRPEVLLHNHYTLNPSSTLFRPACS